MILELSAWKVNQLFSEWLVAQLFEIYGISKVTGKRWLENGRFIFLLDGLDELGLVNQLKCAEAINQFLREGWQPGLVVCCRREESEKAQGQLEELQGAIYLQRLTDNQIYQYLEDLKDSCFQNNLQKSSDLLELARSPLFLSMLAVVEQGEAIRNEHELFDAYIKKQIQDPNHEGTYPPGKSPPPEKTLRYLVWLAEKLEEVGATEFWIEKMQPTWLKSSKQKRLYRVMVGLIGGLIIGLMVGLGGGLGVGLSVGLKEGLKEGLSAGLIYGLKTVIQHLVLRLILCSNGDIPWNYARFLDHAAKQRLVQRVGGRYRFRHRLLRKHIAAMPLNEKELRQFLYFEGVSTHSFHRTVLTHH